MTFSTRSVARAAALGALVASLPAAAQQPRTLPAPEATFEESFSSVAVGAIRELRDGRVIIADARDKVVQVIDFRSGSTASIGREGSGPTEFGLPLRLFAAMGDTTLLFDPLNSRYLVIGPDAKPVTTFRIETPAPRGGGAGLIMMGGGLSARWSDARGRLYGEGSGMSAGPDGRPTPADSVPLLRYDRATNRTDTLAVIGVSKPSIQTSGSQGNMSVSMSAPNPLAPRDEWAVFADGRVAVVRASDYHVEWIQPNGSRTSTAATRYTPIRMTAADRSEEEARRLKARSGQVMMRVEAGNSGVQRSASMGPGANAPPPPPLTDWPETKPPFRPGMASALARSNGELWVMRTESAGAKGTLYDVFNAQGALSHQVRIREGWTLVGFGNGTVYTTKLDEDDLVYLQRHRM